MFLRNVELFSTKFRKVMKAKCLVNLNGERRFLLPWWLRMVAPCDKSAFWCKRQAWLDTLERPPYKALCPLSPEHPSVGYQAAGREERLAKHGHPIMAAGLSDHRADVRAALPLVLAAG